MKKSSKVLQATALGMGLIMGMGCLAACNDDSGNTGGKVDPNKALVVMTEELNGLYNPFYSTAGTDMNVVGQTQISMLTTDENGNLVCGENEPTVALAYEKKTENGNNVYYFVLKNGIKFSDGEPLTMNDVLFNMYVYLDPTYTGSSTMYSTDIQGLQTYRTQTNSSNENEDTELTNTANAYAKNRMDELINLYKTTGQTTTPGSYSADAAKMRTAIQNCTPGVSYNTAIGLEADDIDGARKQLLADYNKIVGDPSGSTAEEKKGYFRTELENDYNSAKEAYLEEPYKSAAIYENESKFSEGFDEVVSFMYMEGYVTLKHPQEVGQNPDKTKIERATINYPRSIDTMEEAINYVYESKIATELESILNFWASGTNLRTEFVAKAKDVILHERLGDSNTLLYPNISGIVSLGHNVKQTSVNVAGKDYAVAIEHNEDGTPKNENEYDVLRISINGIDPKAEWNFSFTVAPYHYYSDPTQEDLKIDIEHYKFGVRWADLDFQQKVIEGLNTWGVSKDRLPLGAGPYIATDANDSDHPQQDGFYDTSKTVYYKSNPNFLLGEPHIKHLKYRVWSSANAIGALQSGDADFIEPQFTKDNADILDNQLAPKGFKNVSTWQLGYGYIGINAQYVKELDLRKAIMSAMNTKLALQFYSTGKAVNIAYPMSLVSWAYPRKAGTTYDGNNPIANADDNNGKSYTQFTDDEAAKKKIRDYMAAAGVPAEDSRLKLKFTIAGASLTEHPCFLVFQHAAQLLNECGWSVEVVPDVNALTKLATGNLAVWAAAWGSTIDPDMYQVYHKNSSASSVLAWGYDDILNDPATYSAENRILTTLSSVIDQARKIDGREQRTALYKTAMGYVLDLAIEMPVYQRQALYAYNANVIDENSLPHDENGELIINSYSSPLSRIWEVKFVGMD